MDKVLVTGAAGFMGSHLVDALVEKGLDVFGVDDLSGGFRRNINSSSHFTQLDLRDTAATAHYVEDVRPALIYHLAADATEGRSQFTPIECTQRNLMAYLNVLTPAIRTGALRKMALTSSMSVYGRQQPPFSESMPRMPEDVYGVAKTAMEQVTEILSAVYEFQYTIIRPHNVYGPRQNIRDPYRNVVGIFINCLLNERSFYIYGDGQQTRAFSYIADVIPAFIAAGFQDDANGEIINVGPREEYTVAELADTILGEFYGGEIPNNVRPKYLPDRPLEVKEAFCTVDKAERLLGFRTTVGLREGVRQMIEWAKVLGPQQPRYLESGLEIVSDKTPATWAQKLI